MLLVDILDFVVLARGVVIKGAHLLVDLPVQYSIGLDNSLLYELVALE